ncbi:MAG: PspC domain-containing protein [Micrococcales bacterium]|nr:PspC domain-containing protein [Micrococcales bacterium]
MVPASARPALLRPVRGRWVGGVAAGLSAHLGLGVGTVRALFAALALAGGAGVFLYVFLWVTVPLGDSRDPALTSPPAATRLARRLPQLASGRRLPATDIGIGLVLVAGAALLLAVRNGWWPQSSWLLPLVLVAGGLGLAWSQLDAVQRRRTSQVVGGRTPAPLLAVAGGVLLAGAGALLFVGQVGGQGLEPAVLVQSVVAGLAILAGVGLVLAPWWLRLVRELGDERVAREREAERADIAAHLHDSVLQTLALIRSRAADPVEVARMARAQERELREWLYADRPAPGTSVAAAVRAVVAEVEDSRVGPDGGVVAVDVVVVGDREPDEGSDALLAATREALVNAVTHGRPPVSLYLEVRDDALEVFVRDRGEGFDLDQVGPDRFGVRESIMGRVRRRGGTATVTSSVRRGTEVHVVMPAQEQRRTS